MLHNVYQNAVLCEDYKRTVQINKVVVKTRLYLTAQEDKHTQVSGLDIM